MSLIARSFSFPDVTTISPESPLCISTLHRVALIVLLTPLPNLPMNDKEAGRPSTPFDSNNSVSNLHRLFHATPETLLSCRLLSSGSLVLQSSKLSSETSSISSRTSSSPLEVLGELNSCISIHSALLGICSTSHLQDAGIFAEAFDTLSRQSKYR